jgi:putative membrane protein
MLATPFIAMLLLTSPVQASRSSNVSTADRDFVAAAARDGQAEVDLATLAQRKATTEPARTLASQLRTDHDRANAELMEIARRKGVNVDPSPTDQQREVATKLTSLEGAAFDTTYTDAMVQAHQRAVQLFEDYSHTGNDPDLRAFAAKALPTLRHHLEMAQAAHGPVTVSR